MKYVATLFILLILISVIVGCDTLGTNSKKSDLIPIKRGILISVTEAYEPANTYNAPVKPHIRLSMISKDIFGYSGYSIITDLKQRGTTLNIDIYGIKDPGGGLATLLPAEARYKLNMGPGEYTLSFTYEKLEQIHLTITDSSLTLSAGETSFIDPQTETFWRYPEKSFAYMCSYAPSRKKYCTELEQILNDSLKIEPFSFPDFGIIPYPVAGGRAHDYVKYYYYKNETAYEKIGAILNDFADSVDIDGDNENPGAYLSVKNWKDKLFYSWGNLDS